MQNPMNLEVYKEGYALSKDIFIELESFKGNFRLREQLFGAVSSIPANLMEFGSMESKTQQSQKIRTCIGEAYEAEYWLNLCVDTGLMPPQKHEEYTSKIKAIRFKLFGLLKAVKLEAQNEKTSAKRQ